MDQSLPLNVILPFEVKDQNGIMNFSVILCDGYLHCRLTCDIPYNHEAWSFHPFGSLNDGSNESIFEVYSVVADNEMTRELCYFIKDNYESPDVQIAIRFLVLFDRKTFQPNLDNLDRVTKLEDEDIDPDSSDDDKGLSSTYFFHRSCVTSNGIKIVVQARKTIYGGYVSFGNFDTNPMEFEPYRPVRFVNKGNLILDKDLPETEITECYMKERSVFLMYDVICTPYCTSSDESHPFYLIYSEMSYHNRRNKLKRISNFIKCNNLMIAILNLISKPDIYLQEEAKTSKTIRYRAYLIEFLTCMWD